MYPEIITIYVLFSLIVLICALKITQQTRHYKPPKRIIINKINNLLYFITILLWPFLFEFICRTVGIGIHTSPFLMIGLMWPIILLTIRMASIDTSLKISNHEDHANHQEARSTGALMFSAAFGVGILLTTINGVQDKQGSKLILASLLLAAAFLMPTSIFKIGTNGSLVVNTIQNCVIHIAIGIFIMGICVSYFSASASPSSQWVGLPRIPIFQRIQ